MWIRLACLWSVLCLAACQAEPRGIRPTPEGSGPRVVFDLDARPLPEIPFPNDLATRPDQQSATGRRVNASMVAPTRLEQRMREKIDRLDGFGTFQPLTVSFDALLDIADLLARQRDNLDFADDAVFLVDLEPESPDFGQTVLLDVGRGNFPLTLETYDNYFPADPRAQASNLLFDTVEEDVDGNGRMDPGEDTDDDGVLDHPNVWPPGSGPLDGLMTFYESETDTLILRPVVPLRERTRYAVVLSERLRGRDGQPVRSPFAWVHHLDQTDEIELLHEVFAGWRRRGIGIDVEDVAFAWVFTTQTITAELVAIREGFYGLGPLAWLAEEFPAEVTPDLAKNERQPLPHYLLESDTLVAMLRVLGPMLLGADSDAVQPLLDTYEHVDYFVSGSFVSPDFMQTGRGDFSEENFAIDLRRGTAEVEPRRIHFLMAVPRPSGDSRQPFDVTVYAHGYGGARFEILAFVGNMARHGIATVGIDAWGSGLEVDEYRELILDVAASYGFDPFAEALLEGRARDLTGDGHVDSGGDTWTAYGFHTRDILRQSVADLMQLVRALKTFDGRTWPLDQDGYGQDDLAGDFDNDGRVDAGGPGVDYFAWGQSMGGIHSAVLGPLEPSIKATAPGCGGGGLADIGMRTMIGRVRDAVLLRVMGPLLIGEAGPDSAVEVSLLVPISNQQRRLVIAEVFGVAPGDKVVVTNVDKGLQTRVTVADGLRFRASLEADQGDRLEVAFFDPDGGLIHGLDRWSRDAYYRDTDQPTYRAGEPLATPAEGFGMSRCTPDLRRMVGLFQMILDPADPANYGRHYFDEPLPIRPEGPVVTNMLEVVTLGDQEVPVNTQATLGRAAGLIPYLEVDSRYGSTVNDWLIANHVYEGLDGRGRFPGPDILFDPDDLDEGADGFDAPAPAPDDRLRIVIDTPAGLSGVRFAYLDPHGRHGVYLPDPSRPFDMDTYFANLIGRYFASGGTRILDHPCLQDASCP